MTPSGARRNPNTINKAGPTGPVQSCGQVPQGKLQLAQNRAARLALGCTQRANTNHMNVNLSWLKVEEKLTSSLLVFMIRLTCWMHWTVCLKYWRTARTPMHTPWHMPQEVSSQSPTPDQTMGGAQHYVEPWLRGTIFHINSLMQAVKLD